MSISYQELDFSCGASTVCVLLQVLGIDINEPTARLLSKTTKEGADEADLMRVIKHYGFRTKEISCSQDHQAWSDLTSGIISGRPAAICVDDWGHWVAVIGVVGDAVVVFDPAAGGHKRLSNEGLSFYKRRELLERWRYAESDPYYYGILVF
jgi:ABC-type bacteriocin/lantibiotic exporter with double-glycine peptidase domain